MNRVFLAGYGNDIGNIIHEGTHAWQLMNDELASPTWDRLFRGQDYDETLPIKELGMTSGYAKVDHNRPKTLLVHRPAVDQSVLETLTKHQCELSSTECRILGIMQMNIGVYGPELSQVDALNQANSFYQILKSGKISLPLLRAMEDVVIYEDKGFGDDSWHSGGNSEAFNRTAEDMATHMQDLSMLHLQIHSQTRLLHNVDYNLALRVLEDKKLLKRAITLVEFGLLPDDYIESIRNFLIGVQTWKERVARGERQGYPHRIEEIPDLARVL